MSRSSKQVRPGWGTLKTYGNLPIPGDVLACVEELGLRIKRVSGDEIVCWCPMHKERTGKEDNDPSWSVTAEDQYNNDGTITPAGTHNCFSCGYKGTFVDLVHDITDMDWDQARSWVRERGGIERVKKVLSRKDNPKPDRGQEISEADLALFTDPPLKELSKRLLSLESAQHYGVLWNPENETWITPIRNPDTGRLWGYQEKNARYFKNQPMAVPKSKTLFGYQEFDGDTAILVESPLDVVRLHSVGVHGGLAAFGVHVSDAQMDLVLDAAETLILALDMDKDGEKISAEIREKWSRRGLIIKFFNYEGTDAKDPGEMTADQIKNAIRTSYASPLAKFDTPTTDVRPRQRRARRLRPQQRV